MAERSGDYPYAVRMARQIEQMATSTEIECLARYYAGLCEYDMKHYRVAVHLSEDNHDCPTNISERMQYQNALSLMRMSEWENARGALLALAQTGDFRKAVTWLY